MKFITQLHDKHLNKPMWIVGSDPTLDSYPDNFLDDKLGMTLHLAGLKFPNATYRYFNELDRITHLIKVNPSFKEKANIFAFPFYERKERETWPVAGSNVHFLLLKPYPPRKIRDDIFNEIGVNAMIEQVGIAREGKTIVFGGFATCLHCGFFTAIMMGCNPINIIGSNHDTINGKDHFNQVEEVDRKMRPTAPRYNQARRGEMMRAGTEAIIEGCKRNNIKVNRYKNYEDFKLRNSNQK